MKERPILFSAPMVRAILAGRKTQTRRVVREPLASELSREGWPDVPPLAIASVAAACPYGEPGDRLWVRETWCQQACMVHGDLLPGKAHYRADGYEVRHVDGPEKSPWRPSIFMPRWASRITLDVTAVRVERLQDITEEDARAEGCFVDEAEHGPCDDQARDVFLDLWDRINGKRAPWASSPWVWVVSFRRVAP